MGLPRIGITTYGRNAEDRYTLPAPYVEAVQRAGALPFLIPPGAAEPERYLDHLDGLVLAGGGDLDPGSYGGDAHATLYHVDPARDALELALARAVVRRGLPALGICRGLQVLNVAHGGTLIPHLPDAVGESVLHRAPPREPVPHPVAIAPDSRLARIAGTAAMAPLSWHHQAVRRVAPGFRAVAHAADGTIEALEHESLPWLFAVQWHPELSAASDPAQQRLFDALAAAVSERTSPGGRHAS